MSVQIGLSDIHFALLTSDDSTGAKYEVPERIPGAIAAKISPKTSTETLYTDDGPSEVSSALGEVSVEIEVKDIPLDVQAKLLGGTVNTDGVLVSKSGDSAPYLALGFRSLKSNGKYRYVWLYKGKFELFDEDYQTKEDKVKFNTPKVKASFVKRDFDGAWKATGDEDSATFTPAIAAAWFTKVYEETAV